MPTFNQSKPGNEGEPAAPAARQLTAEDRELMLKLGLPPEVADAYLAGGTFTCVDEAVKHYRAQAEAAPAPAPPPIVGAFTLAYDDGLKIQVVTIDEVKFVSMLVDAWNKGTAVFTGGGVTWPTAIATRGLHRWYPSIKGEFVGGVGKQVGSGEKLKLAADTLFQVWAVLEPDRRPRLAMPIRRSETAVERDSAGDITRSVTVERDA